MVIITSVFSKLVIMMILFRCSGLGGATKESSVAMLKPVKVMNMLNAREVTMKVKSGYVALYVINDP